MSDTVKLIIEIPKATYDDIKSGKIYSSLCEAPIGLVEGIRDGTPLDDVKAEIMAKHVRIAEKNDFDNGRTYGYEECLSILDKHRGGENK